jgi:hypothetical protein
VNLVGGKIAGAIKGEQVMALDKQQFPLRVSASTVFWPFGHPLCFTAGLPATPSSKIACS